MDAFLERFRGENPEIDLSLIRTLADSISVGRRGELLVVFTFASSARSAFFRDLNLVGRPHLSESFVGGGAAAERRRLLGGHWLGHRWGRELLASPAALFCVLVVIRPHVVFGKPILHLPRKIGHHVRDLAGCQSFSLHSGEHSEFQRGNVGSELEQDRAEDAQLVQDLLGVSVRSSNRPKLPNRFNTTVALSAGLLETVPLMTAEQMDDDLQRVREQRVELRNQRSAIIQQRESLISENHGLMDGCREELSQVYSRFRDMCVQCRGSAGRPGAFEYGFLTFIPAFPTGLNSRFPCVGYCDKELRVGLY